VRNVASPRLARRCSAARLGRPRSSSAARASDPRRCRTRARLGARAWSQATAEAGATSRRPCRPRGVDRPCRDGPAAIRGVGRDPFRRATALPERAVRPARGRRRDLQLLTVRSVAGRAHHGNDLFDLGRISRVAQPLVARRTPSVEPRDRCRRTASSCAVQHHVSHGPCSSTENDLSLRVRLARAPAIGFASKR
jgi:hypothetical protein